MKRRDEPAFSLMEVMIALGVVSFGLIALIGLLSVGMVSDRSAGDDTALSTMSSRIVAELKNADADGLGKATNGVSFFDAYGLPTTAPRSEYYGCRVFLAATNLPTAVPAPFSIVRLQFVWPVTVPRPTHTNTVYATLPSGF